MEKKKYFLGATRPIADVATHQIAPQSMIDEDCNSCYNFCNMDVELYREDGITILVPKCQKCLNKFARYVASLELCVKKVLETSDNEGLHNIINDLLCGYFAEACENSENLNDEVEENSQNNNELPLPNIFGERYA